MRIGFDISQTGQTKAGCGYYADTLIRHIADMDKTNEYVLYPTFGDFYFDRRMPLSCPIRQQNFSYGLRHYHPWSAREFWSSPPSDFEFQLGSPDIVHANNYFCPASLTSARLVYTLYDLGFLKNPEWTTEPNRTGCFAGVFKASLYADLIIAISQYSRGQFLETFPHYPVERIAVVYPGSRFITNASTLATRSVSGLQPEKFWLSVGTVEPRKNHKRLLEAYVTLKAHAGDAFPLVIAGAEGWLMKDFKSHVDELGLQKDVICLGYADDDSLRWLYQNCFAMLYPSLLEGYGLPVVEAMTLGAPVITSNVSSLPEVVGSAGLTVDPTKEGEIYGAMRKLVSDPAYRLDLKRRSIAQAQKFSWQRAAKEITTLYDALMNEPKRHTKRLDPHYQPSAPAKTDLWCTPTLQSEGN
jgi:glycosyltransferase involved in cell wall biosynthesis